MIKLRLTREGRGEAAHETNEPKHGDCETDKFGLRGGPARKLSEARTYKGREDLTVIIGNVELVHSGFFTRKKFSENYPKFGHESSKMFTSPVLG